MLKVEDIMVEDVITVDSDVQVMEAVKLMNQNEIGCLVVTRRGKAIGILTERDLLKRVIVKLRDPKKIKVRQIMTKPLIVGDPDMNLEDATKIMFDRKIKKLPVIESRKLVGLVSLTDIARYQPQMMKILKRLFAQHAPPKRLQKVIGYYVV
ncbi:MAG: CBS domain-containing protein [Candidatus Bathyarchaeota archaeon]|jgi:CBS domain-containing protein|nr:CBS domain-containing protein [Candidatus Bathyarchaeota archaeon]